MSIQTPIIEYAVINPDRASVISEVRRLRPKVLSKDVKKLCPFCPGNEELTPPATLILRMVDGKLIYDKDRNGERIRDWIVRIVPNKYPAFTTVIENRSYEEGLIAYGYHEVIIESKDHDKQPPDMELSEIMLAFKTIFKRIQEVFSNDKRVRYVLLIRNYGAKAGASISHPHMQLFITRTHLPIIAYELRQFVRLSKFNICPLCLEILKAIKDKRVVFENKDFIVFTSRSPRQPYECIIAPKKHLDNPLTMNDELLKNFSEAYREILRAIKQCLNNPDYNLWFHIPPRNYLGRGIFHWHVEIEPLLNIWGGLERGGGVYIVTTHPKKAAEDLRNSLSNQL